MVIRLLLGTLAFAAVGITTRHLLFRSTRTRVAAVDRVLSGILVAFCTLSLAGLGLSFTGRFSLAALVVTMLAVAGVMALLTRRTGGIAMPLPGAAEAAAPCAAKWFQVGMLAAGLGLCLRTGEPVAGNWDPGVYLAQGAALAQGGGYLFEDTASPLLNTVEKQALYPVDRHARVKYPGFYVAPNRPHRLEPQFYPLLPVLLASANVLSAFSASLYVVGVLSLLSLALVLRLGDRLGGWVCAVAAGLVFLLNPVQIWFSGFPTAEVLMQFFFLAGLWTWVLWLDTESPPLAWLSGTCFGLVMFTSVTGLLLVALWVAAQVIQVQRKPGSLGLVGPVLVLAPLVAIQNLFFTRQYFEGVRAYVPALLSMLTHPLVLLPVFGTVLTVLSWRFLVNPAARSKALALAKPVLLVLGGAVLLWTGYRLFAGNPDLDRLRIISSMISRVQLLVALAGLFLLAWKRPRLGWTLILVAGLFTYVFMSSRMMVRMYPWAFKRYLAVTLPVLCLGAGYAWSRASQIFKHPAARVLVLAVVLALGLRLLHRGRAFAFHRDWSGLLSFSEAVADALPPAGVVLADKWIATPLEFIHGKRVVPMHVPADAAVLPSDYVALARRLAAGGHPVSIAYQPARVSIAPLHGQRVFSETLTTSVLDQSRLPFAAAPRKKSIHLEVVRITGDDAGPWPNESADEVKAP